MYVCMYVCMYVHCTYSMYVMYYMYVYSLKYSGSSPGVSHNSSGMGRVWGMFSGIVSSGSESILISARHTIHASLNLNSLTHDHTCT